MIERETATTVFVRARKPIREMLGDHKIYTAPDGSSRWSDRDLIKFDKNCVIEPYAGFFSGYALCSMGAFSYSNSEIPPDVIVGRYCSFGASISWPGGRHNMDAISTSAAFYFGRAGFIAAGYKDAQVEQPFPRITPLITIAPKFGADVWVGNKASFNSGVVIGPGSVVGAHALVTREVAPYTIVGGNPARYIRHRLADGVWQQMLETRWWRFGIKALAGFPVHDPQQFLARFDELRDAESWQPAALHVWDEVQRLAG